MDIVKAFRYNDKLVCIRVDPNPRDPRKEFSNAGIFWAWHKRYSIGDADEVTRYGKTFYKSDFDPSKFNSFRDLTNAIYGRHVPVALLPVYLKDHGDLTLSVYDFRDPWDSGQVGVIWFPREGLADLGYKRATDRACAKARELLKAEIEVQNAYISGDVYGWELYAMRENSKTEFLDSCWGYYGNSQIPHMLECALGSSEAASAAVELTDREIRKLELEWELEALKKGGENGAV
jgi:hypothetical protein